MIRVVRGLRGEGREVIFEISPSHSLSWYFKVKVIFYIDLIFEMKNMFNIWNVTDFGIANYSGLRLGRITNITTFTSEAGGKIILPKNTLNNKAPLQQQLIFNKNIKVNKKIIKQLWNYSHKYQPTHTLPKISEEFHHQIIIIK